MKAMHWSIAEIVNILKARQQNEFDGNFVVSGSRGEGKSQTINKILYRFKAFKPWKHQVYSREDIISLLQNQQYGVCWDDEAINTGYKRNFQVKGQQELIKLITAYRDNFNIYASAIPNFFSLDKDLRDLYFLHIHIIERGLAIVHMPLQGRLYSQDRWDVKYNSRIEEKWGKKAAKDPDFKPPYHRLTTFRGYLISTKLTELQEKLYKQIKRDKRAKAFKPKKDEKEFNFRDQVYEALIRRELTKPIIMQFCKMHNEKYTHLLAYLGRRLHDSHVGKTVMQILNETDPTNKETAVSNEMESLIPSV